MRFVFARWLPLLQMPTRPGKHFFCEKAATLSAAEGPNRKTWTYRLRPDFDREVSFWGYVVPFKS